MKVLEHGVKKKVAGSRAPSCVPIGPVPQQPALCRKQLVNRMHKHGAWSSTAYIIYLRAAYKQVKTPVMPVLSISYC